MVNERGTPAARVAANDLDFLDLVAREGRADALLDQFGGGLADQHVVLAAYVGHDALVELVAADAHALGVDDAVQRDHRHFGGTTADIDHHAAARVADGEARAERGGDGFFDDVHRARAGVQHAFLDRPALDLGAAVGHADHHAGGLQRITAPAHLADEALGASAR